MQILKAGFLYFVLVFGVGFVLGTIRTLWVAPRLGVRLAELAELGLVSWVRGLSIDEYFATRDPVSGTAYYVALVLFAVMPLFVARR
jgi:hypothetical protein